MNWFRLYSSMLHDPKVQQLPPSLFKFWINLLCLVNETSRDTGALPPLATVSFSLRQRQDRCQLAVRALTERGLVDASNDGLMVHGWTRRQYKSDDVTARVKRFRNVSETPPETEQNRDRNRSSSPAAAPANNHAAAVSLLSKFLDETVRMAGAHRVVEQYGPRAVLDAIYATGIILTGKPPRVKPGLRNPGGLIIQALKENRPR